MPNKPGHKILLAVLLFASGLAVNSHAQDTNAPILDCLMQEYQAKAPYFLDKQSWRDIGYVQLTQEEKTQLEEMKVLLTKILLIPESHDAILALLQSYQEHDGYARQTLFRALRDTTYYKSDLPFLKSVFLSTLACKKGNYPNRLQGWIRPDTFLHLIAPLIYGLATPSGPMNEVERDLLFLDPKKWIELQVP